MTKQGVKEKYEMYLNGMRRIINTNTHKTNSTKYNKAQVIHYHTNAIRTLI